MTRIGTSQSDIDLRNYTNVITVEPASSDTDGCRMWGVSGQDHGAEVSLMVERIGGDTIEIGADFERWAVMNLAVARGLRDALTAAIGDEIDSA